MSWHFQLILDVNYDILKFLNKMELTILEILEKNIYEVFEH